MPEATRGHARSEGASSSAKDSLVQQTVAPKDQEGTRWRHTARAVQAMREQKVDQFFNAKIHKQAPISNHHALTHFTHRAASPIQHLHADGYTVENTLHLNIVNHSHGRTKPNQQLLQHECATAPVRLWPATHQHHAYKSSGYAPPKQTCTIHW